MPRSSSVQPPKVTHVNAPATPPKPGSPEHWHAWLQQYGGDYTTDAERRAAYQDFTTNLDTIQAVFSQSDDMHAVSYTHLTLPTIYSV